MKDVSDENLQFLIDWAAVWVKSRSEYFSVFPGYTEFFTIFALLLDEKLQRNEC